jgi:hypothetical protein
LHVLDATAQMRGDLVADRQGGLDECGMGEGLGVVAEVAAVPGVDLLGQEAERVGEVEEVVEQLGCFVDPARGGEGWLASLGCSPSAFCGAGGGLSG